MLLNCGAGEDSKSPLDCKEIQPVHPKGDQSWVFIGRTDVEAETAILWPPDAKSWLWKRPWCWERLKAGEKGMTEEEMVVWHHQLNGHQFEQILGDSEEQGCLACCSSWGRKESDTTEWLNWTDVWAVVNSALLLDALSYNYWESIFLVRMLWNIKVNKPTSDKIVIT